MNTTIETHEMIADSYHSAPIGAKRVLSLRGRRENGHWLEQVGSMSVLSFTGETLNIQNSIQAWTDWKQETGTVFGDCEDGVFVKDSRGWMHKNSSCRISDNDMELLYAGTHVLRFYPGHGGVGAKRVEQK